MAANDAPPAAWIRPSARSVTRTGSGSTRRSPSNRGWTTYSAIRQARYPGQSPTGRHTAMSGGSGRRFQPVRCSEAMVPSLRPSGERRGGVNGRRRTRHERPASGGVEQQVAQAAVAYAHLDQGVETAPGVGLDGLTGPAAGIDRAAEPRVRALDGGDERRAPKGAVAEGERVPQGVLRGGAATDVGVALGVERGEVAFVPGRVAVLGAEAHGVVDAQWAIAARDGRCEQGCRQREQRQRQRERRRGRDAHEEAARCGGSAVHVFPGHCADACGSGGAAVAATPALRSTVVAKRHVTPPFSEISTMR